MNATFDFTGKVALVTGSGSGMGRASAAAFAAAGASVAVADIDPEGGRQTVQQIEADGGTATFFEVDVSSELAVARLIEDVEAHYGALDIAHNNAGIEADLVPMADLSGDAWRRLIDINLSSVFYSMKAEIPAMVRRGGGAIVNTASASGLIGGYQHSDYVASKHGVVGLTKAAAMDYATQAVRVNSICPGLIETPFIGELPRPAIDRLMLATPMTRMGQPAEIAQAVLWLCSDAASYVTGHALAVDGGVALGGTGSRFDDLF
jgi:NAD(P)-dependent dehydrogenase (short-subunit alcohol dehydrogenase family)